MPKRKIAYLTLNEGTFALFEVDGDKIINLPDEDKLILIEDLHRKLPRNQSDTKVVLVWRTLSKAIGNYGQTEAMFFLKNKNWNNINHLFTTEIDFDY